MNLFPRNTGQDNDREQRDQKKEFIERKKEPPQLNSKATVRQDPIYQAMKYTRGFSKVFEPEQPEPDQTMIPEPSKQKKKRGLDNFVVKGYQNRPASNQQNRPSKFPNKKGPSAPSADDTLVILD